jgi:hypothetical protein
VPWRPDRRRRSQSTSPSERPSQPDVSDAEFVIGQTGDWIRSADTKAGLLLAALTVLLGWLGSSVGTLRCVWSGHPQRLGSLLALGGSVLFLSVAVGLLIAVLLPRRSAPTATRYAWPWVHRTSIEELLALAPDSRRVEAWRQAKQMAMIAAHKHTLFTAAVWFSAGSVACLVVWGVSRQ